MREEVRREVGVLGYSGVVRPCRLTCQRRPNTTRNVHVKPSKTSVDNVSQFCF